MEIKAQKRNAFAEKFTTPGYALNQMKKSICPLFKTVILLPLGITNAKALWTGNHQKADDGVIVLAGILSLGCIFWGSEGVISLADQLRRIVLAPRSVNQRKENAKQILEQIRKTLKK